MFKYIAWLLSFAGFFSCESVLPQDLVAAPSALATTDLRCGGVSWGDGDLALLYQSWCGRYTPVQQDPLDILKLAQI